MGLPFKFLFKITLSYKERKWRFYRTRQDFIDLGEYISDYDYSLKAKTTIKEHIETLKIEHQNENQLKNQ